MTTSTPPNPPSTRPRAIAFNLRRTRLRCTALPTFFVTIKPKRAGSVLDRAERLTTAFADALRRPRRSTARYSSAVTSRFARANTLALRRRVRCGPCDDARPGSRGQRVCACATGIRAPWRDGGCWAEKSSCSLHFSTVLCDPRDYQHKDSTEALKTKVAESAEVN